MLPMVPSLEDRAKPLKRTQQNLRKARMSDLPTRVGYTVMFLRMTATQMRELADATPEIARELRGIAEQVQVEADSLAGHMVE